MKDFLNLTTSEGQEIIVNTNSVSSIHKKEDGQAYITLNFSRGENNSPVQIHVKESFQDIKEMLQ